MFDVFCRDFLEGGGVFAETRVFLSPIPMQIVRAVWCLLLVESEDLIENFCTPLHVDQSVGIFFSAEVVNSLNTSVLLSMLISLLESSSVLR